MSGFFDSLFSPDELDSDTAKGGASVNGGRRPGGGMGGRSCTNPKEQSMTGPHDNGATSPSFIDSFHSLKDKILMEANELLSNGNEDAANPSTSKKHIPENGAKYIAAEPPPAAEPIKEIHHTYTSSTKKKDGEKVKTTSDKPLLTNSSKPALIKAEPTTPTLLVKSVPYLEIKRLKPGVIPSLDDISNDISSLEGVDPEQVKIIQDKINVLQFTILSLEKQLGSVDSRLDKLRMKNY